MPKKPKWNEVRCPECKEPVAVDATRCPHCQAIYAPEAVERRKTEHASNQKFGAIGCGVIIVLLLLLLSFCGDTSEENSSSSSSVAADPQSWPEAGSAAPAVTAAMIRFNDSIMSAMKPCDEAGANLADVAGGLGSSTSIYDGFAAAQRTEDACRSSLSRLNALDVPDALAEVAGGEAEEALETCESAALSKQMGAAAMQEVFDGDLRPSKLQEVQEQANATQAAVLACVAGIFATAGAAGVDPAEFESDM